MNVYIAGPFFNDAQIERVVNIEELLVSMGIEFFSPMRHGVLNVETQDKAQSIFDGNVSAMDKASTIIAIIDDRDTGTIWEMGYAYATEKDIITYTTQEHGLNIMLAKSVRAHCETILKLSFALNDPNYNRIYTKGLF